LILSQNSFDFIHLRSVVQGITKWPQVLAEAYRCLKPGGYIELSELGSKFSKDFSIRILADFRAVHAQSDDGTLKEDNPLTKFGNLMNEALIASGRVAPSEELPNLLDNRANFL
jgi:ubiquinone/menaquinone biosynthesis C-methylase UbiE